MGLVALSNHSQLMEENGGDGYRTDVANGNEPIGIEATADGVPVGELVFDYPTRDHPAEEEAGEKTAKRQQEVGGETVAEFHKRRTEDLQLGYSSRGQRAGYGEQAAHEGDNEGCLPTAQSQLFAEEGSTYLVHGDGGGEGCQRQKGVEEHGDDVAHDWHGSKGLCEDSGQSDENERRTAIWAHTNGSSCREYHESGKDGYHTVEQSNLQGRGSKVDLTAEVGGVGAETCCAKTQREESLSEGF